MYEECHSHADQSECVASLADRCDALCDNLDYADYDARMVVLRNVSDLARAGQMVLNLLDSWTRGDNIVRQTIPQLVGLATVTPEAVQTAGEILNKASKLGFGVLAQFQIENGIRAIARELGLSPKLGFYNLAKSLLAAVELPEGHFQILYTPALIRNSLHNNGIHKAHGRSDTVVTVDGVTYEFRHDQPVHCASWQHIAHALEASIGILDDIFHAEQVQNIPHAIMDEYARHIETRT